MHDMSQMEFCWGLPLNLSNECLYKEQNVYDQCVVSTAGSYYYPAPRMRSEGSSDCSWRPDIWDISANKNLKLKEYSLF